ncbi:MAG TPA: hypothetical protein VF062_05855, partial [Candidatus Limnocylindrales bacterium]
QDLVTSIFCQPALSFGLPNGEYFVCAVQWRNDGSPTTAQWVNPQAQRQPVVTTNSAERWSRATFNCNDPGGGGFTFSSHVVVTGATGTMTTPYTIPCGW